MRLVANVEHKGVPTLVEEYALRTSGGALRLCERSLMVVLQLCVSNSASYPVNTNKIVFKNLTESRE